jgi:hypothetical protein
VTLTAGTRIGSYEIVGPLGAGGMGEIYRARDVRLDRTVAIKALPQAFAHDPERRARFEREARLLASLSHPNIAGIYGVEDFERVPFLVLEYVPGETLGVRLSREPLPVPEAVRTVTTPHSLRGVCPRRSSGPRKHPRHRRGSRSCSRGFGSSRAFLNSRRGCASPRCRFLLPT